MSRPERNARRSGRGWTTGLVTGTALVVTATVPAGPAAGSAYPSAGPAHRVPGATPVPVSGPSPFASCTADQTPGDGFTPNTESEAHVAVDPGRPNRIAVAYRQDLWASGSSRGIVIGSSGDGGHSWRRTVLPGAGACAGGSTGRATNPWLTFGPTGVLYAGVTGSGHDATTVTVSRSLDGGRTWDGPAVLTRDPRPGFFNDKQAVTVDPHDPRRVYVVWNRRDLTADTHDVMLARSADGGRTWGAARPVHRPATRGAGTLGNQIVVLRDGTLVNLFMENDHPIGGPPYPGDLPERVRVMRSADHGATWSEPVTVADVDLNQPLLPDNPPYLPVIAPGVVPDIALDRRTGALYVVWAETGLSESLSAVALSASTDGGRTWSERRKVGLTPDSAAYGNGQAFLPQVDVAADGTVGVSYYDFRDNTPDPGGLTGVWLAACRAASCADPSAHWTERRLAGPFDIERAPHWFGGPYIGSYTGLAHSGRAFIASLVVAGTGTDPAEAPEPTDVVVARSDRAQ